MDYFAYGYHRARARALSRVREYYADRYNVSLVDDGARKLSVALVKIGLSTQRGERKLAARAQ